MIVYCINSILEVIDHGAPETSPEELLNQKVSEIKEMLTDQALRQSWRWDVPFGSQLGIACLAGNS